MPKLEASAPALVVTVCACVACNRVCVRTHPRVGVCGRTRVRAHDVCACVRERMRVRVYVCLGVCVYVCRRCGRMCVRVHAST